MTDLMHGLRSLTGDWSNQANCVGEDPDIFFSEGRGRSSSEAQAKKLCAACPVQTECLNIAVENGDTFGIFGGLTAEERYKRFRPRKAA